MSFVSQWEIYSLLNKFQLPIMNSFVILVKDYQIKNHILNPNMSQQVLWEVVKNNNAFLVKNNGLRLSRDPFNNTGV